MAFDILILKTDFCYIDAILKSNKFYSTNRPNQKDYANVKEIVLISLTKNIGLYEFIQRYTCDWNDIKPVSVPAGIDPTFLENSHCDPKFNQNWQWEWNLKPIVDVFNNELARRVNNGYPVLISADDKITNCRDWGYDDYESVLDANSDMPDAKRIIQGIIDAEKAKQEQIQKKEAAEKLRKEQEKEQRKAAKIAERRIFKEGDEVILSDGSKATVIAVEDKIMEHPVDPDPDLQGVPDQVVTVEKASGQTIKIAASILRKLNK